MSKVFTLVLILIIAISSLSLIIVKPASAQSIPIPSVPKLTLRFAPAFSNVTTNIMVEESTVCIIINNQNFTSYFDANTNSTIAIYYNVQVKEHNSNNWVELYDSNNYPYYPIQWDNSSQSILPITQEKINFAYELKALKPINYFNGSQIDFQVQALLGNVTLVYGAKTLPTPYGFIGEQTQEPVWKTLAESDWTNTQTITVPVSSTSASPTSTPIVPEFPLMTLPWLLSLLSVAIILTQKKPRICSKSAN